MTRAALLLLLVLGPSCAPGASNDPDDGFGDTFGDDYYADDGWSSDDSVISGCTADESCATGEVCARDGACYDPAVIHAVRVHWTLRGEPATPTACDAYARQLEINFHSPLDSMRFLPVPCHLGLFTIDKLPLHFDAIQLGPRDSANLRRALIPASGDVTLDLP